MKSVLITGGSGFIGTSVVEAYRAAGDAVLNIDIDPPQNPEHGDVFRRVDIRDADALTAVFSEFAPTHVIHLAARADLHGKRGIEDYDTNTTGVANMVKAVAGQPSVVRCMFTSTKLVCPTDYAVTSTDEYHPNTLYGESKVVGEQIVRDDTTMTCEWCIVRPTSIWGPWSCRSHIPYGRFFQMIARGRYYHPGHVDAPRSFGYVGNYVYQVRTLLDAPAEQIHRRIFYLSDYEIFNLETWANMISMKVRGRNAKRIPIPIVHLLAWAGDLLKLCGMKDPPLSSFRLRNMRADTTKFPLAPTETVVGPLPYSLEQGVDETIAWFQEHDLF